MVDDKYEDQPEMLRPVAYDSNGQPLYAAPPAGKQLTSPDASSHITAAPAGFEGHNYDPRMRVQYGNEPNVIHQPRPYEPVVSKVSPELQAKHDDSTRRYPDLNLSEGEYVIMSVTRHPIGLWAPIFVTLGVISILTAGLVLLPTIAADSITGEVPNYGLIAVITMCLIALVGLGGYISVWVYLRNTFYLTNESVIQEIQQSLFAKREQSVSLGSIEDASFVQSGLIQTMFDYGSIRLSTEGDETTYRFQYVASPKIQIATVNNAIESFKNGRPVEDLN